MSGNIFYWDKARESYRYPFNLGEFHRKSEFFDLFFEDRECEGDRDSTLEFEKYYQKNAPDFIEVYIEVFFWKLYSKRQYDPIFDRGEWYNLAINTLKKSSATEFWHDITNFVHNLTEDNISGVKKYHSNIAHKVASSSAMIIPLTFVSLAYPDKIPMIDSRVIQWINNPKNPHNQNRTNLLQTFSSEKPRIDSDFKSYMSWVKWCNDSATLLNESKNSIYEDWRPRDVEMAIFSSQRLGFGGLLEVLK